MRTNTGTRKKCAIGGPIPILDVEALKKLKARQEAPTFTPQGGTILQTNEYQSPAVVNPYQGVGTGIRVAGQDAAGSDRIPIGTRIAGAANAVAPFVSNIANSFRTPPKPALPIMNSPVTLRRTNRDADRYRVGREVGAADANARRTLPSNTAAAIEASNLGTKINAISEIGAAENRDNAQISNTETLTNAQIAAGNNEKMDSYGQLMTERNVAQQREQSSNLSNAADKYIAIKNEAAKAKLDKDKTRILSTMFTQSGVYKRLGKIWKEQGQEDPMGMNYSWLDDMDKKEEKAYGGIIKKRTR